MKSLASAERELVRLLALPLPVQLEGPRRSGSPCALFVALTFYFDANLPLWLQGLSMLVMFIGMGAGFLLLREIPYAYPVYVVNWHEPGHRRPRRGSQWT